jgi:hypothetical protein
MNLKKTIIVGILFTSLNSEANDEISEEISYDWLEISYGDKLNGSLSEFTTLGGSFSISDNFYITADASKYRRFNLLNETSIGIRLGFHKALTEKSDFYAEVGYRNLHLESFESSDKFGFKIGTRSILSPKIELITHLEYKDIDIEVFSDEFRFRHSQSGLSYGVKSLYKINKSSNISFGLSVDDSFVSPSIGYRFNW